MARRFLPSTPEKLSEAAQDVADREQVVASTAISSVSYNFINDEVTINFTDGSTYIYYGVDVDTYVGLIRSSSKGAYFNENIRNAFNFSRG